MESAVLFIYVYGFVFYYSLKKGMLDVTIYQVVDCLFPRSSTEYSNERGNKHHN